MVGGTIRLQSTRQFSLNNKETMFMFISISGLPPKDSDFSFQLFHVAVPQSNRRQSTIFSTSDRTRLGAEVAHALIAAAEPRQLGNLTYSSALTC